MSGLHVLLAEDLPASQRRISGHLLQLGCRVQLVTTGWEVLAAVSQCSPDWLVIDSQLPEMNGCEALERLEGGPPVVMLVLDEQEGQRCLRAGARACLLKPVVLEDLTRLLGTPAVSTAPTPSRLAQENRDFLRSLLADAEECLPRYLHLLGNAWRGRRGQEAAEQARRLQSTAAMLGMVSLSRQAEELARQAQIGEFGDGLQSLPHLIEQSLAGLRATG